MVKGHPRYSVSCDGQILSWNWNNTGKPRLCRLGADSNGYLRVCIDGVVKKVHRIVAEAFIHNTKDKPCIDHINTVKTDNRVENLRWCTCEENNNNPLTLEHNAWRGKFGDEHPNSIEIVQLTLDGQFIRKWACAEEVQRELGINQGNIIKCCRGKRKSAGGFYWMYYSDWLKLQRKTIKDIKPLF